MSATIELREVVMSDLPIFFDQMRDPAAVQMAAFASKNPDDRATFDAHWARIRAADDILLRTIVVNGRVAGSITTYPDDGQREVAYWIGREFWGRGIATAALKALLQLETRRPLHARAAADNIASLRVMEKCGFARIGYDRGYANAHRAEIDEVLLELTS